VSQGIVLETYLEVFFSTIPRLYKGVRECIKPYLRAKHRQSPDRVRISGDRAVGNEIYDPSNQLLDESRPSSVSVPF
jgi:hypothetical protein